MAIECAVITGIFLLFIFVCLRNKHKQWAWATLPLCLLPTVDFVLELVVIKAMKVEVSAFGGVLALLIAVVAAAAWIGAVSNNFKSKRTKVSYLGITNVFNVTLAAIIINDLLSRAGHLEAQIVV